MLSSEDLYNCTRCSKERAKDSEVCPHCGTTDAYWTVYAGKWFWALLLFGGIWYFERETSIIEKSFQKLIFFIYS